MRNQYAHTAHLNDLDRGANRTPHMRDHREPDRSGTRVHSVAGATAVALFALFDLFS